MPIELPLSLGKSVKIEIVPHCLLDQLPVLLMVMEVLVEVFSADGSVSFKDTLH